MIQTENKCIWLKIGHISYCDKPCVKKTNTAVPICKVSKMEVPDQNRVSNAK